VGYNYATYREQSPALGRFFSPDRLLGDTSNPQSLNMYTYALNNPTNVRDPLGLCGESSSDECFGSVFGPSFPYDPSISGVNENSQNPDLASIVGGRGNCAVGTSCYAEMEAPYDQMVKDSQLALAAKTPPNPASSLHLTLDSDCGGNADRTIHYSLSRPDGSRTYGYAVIQHESDANRVPVGGSIFGSGTSYQGAGEFTDSIRVGLGGKPGDSKQTFFAAQILGNGNYGAPTPVLVTPTLNPTAFPTPWGEIGVYINESDVFVQGTNTGASLANCHEGF
jgi:hypothetical protein